MNLYNQNQWFAPKNVSSFMKNHEKNMKNNEILALRIVWNVPVSLRPAYWSGITLGMRGHASGHKNFEAIPFTCTVFQLSRDPEQATLHQSRRADGTSIFTEKYLQPEKIIRLKFV